MEKYDVTEYPEGYRRVMNEELGSKPEEEREGYMIGLIRFMISC